MENALLEKLIQYGGAVAVIGAMTVFVFYLTKLFRTFKENKNGKSIIELEKQISQIENNHLIAIENRLSAVENRLNALSERVARLEEKIKK